MTEGSKFQTEGAMGGKRCVDLRKWQQKANSLENLHWYCSTGPYKTEARQQFIKQNNIL